MLCLNYLLKLQFLQSMRPLTSAKQANMSFGLRLSSDVACPTDLLAAQVCDSSSDVLRLFFAEGTWRKKEEKRQPRSPCSWIENIHQINISIGHQSTEQSVVKLAWCICGGSFSTQDLAPQLLKTPKSDYHHILLLCQALLVSLFVFVCFFLHQNIPAVPSALICPESILCTAAVQQLKSKQEELKLKNEKALYSRAAMHSILLVPKARSRLSASSTATQSQLSGLFTTKGTTAVQVGPTDTVLFKLLNTKIQVDWAILKQTWQCRTLERV